MKKNINFFQKNPLLILLSLVILLILFIYFIGIKLFYKFLYTNAKMNYKELEDFWDNGTYNLKYTGYKSKAYPNGFTGTGIETINTDYNKKQIKSNINGERIIADGNRQIIQSSDTYTHSPFTNQVRNMYTNNLGAYGDRCVSMQTNNNIILYTDTFDSQIMGKENILIYHTIKKTESGYIDKIYQSHNNGLTWNLYFEQIRIKQ